MKKLIFIAVAMLTLSACGPASYSDYSNEYSSLPPELQGCKIYGIKSNDGGYMKVLYCSDKKSVSTTYPEGKTQSSAAIVKDVTINNVPSPPSDTLGSKTEFKAVLVTDGLKTTNLNCKIMSGLPVCFVENKQ